jgi:hypothetical protein
MNQRVLNWAGFGFVIFVFDFIVYTLSLGDFLNIAKWNFVPSIVNGIVSSSAILIAVAIFSVNYFSGTITSVSTKKGFHALALHYILSLFALLIGEVFFGYFSVTAGLLPLALCVFMNFFFLQCGVLFDLWLDGQKYCFN